MLIRDMMQLYAMKRESTDLMLILSDYKLDNRLDREVLNNKFLLDIGECIPYYNETTVLKFAIDNFFDVNELNIKRLVDTIFAEYEMLRDYDMTTEEDIVDDRDTTETEGIARNRTDAQDTTVDHDSTVDHDNRVTVDNSKTHDEDQTESINRIVTENGTDTEENVVSAYNASTYQPRDKGTTIHAEQDTVTENNTRGINYTEDIDETTVTDESTVTDETTVTDYDETENETTNRNERGTDDYTRDRDVREYGIKNGNTYQDLIEKERKVALFNIYEWIINKLSNEICLQIW